MSLSRACASVKRENIHATLIHSAHMSGVMFRSKYRDVSMIRTVILRNPPNSDRVLGMGMLHVGILRSLDKSDTFRDGVV